MKLGYDCPPPFDDWDIFWLDALRWFLWGENQHIFADLLWPLLPKEVSTEMKYYKLMKIGG